MTERRATSSSLIALVVAIAFFMQNLDGSIITTSLPQIAASFGVRPIDLSIGITAYLIAIVALIPSSAWLADRFGPRTVFATAIVIFTIASVACGLTRSLGAFVAARTVQGMGAALMGPVGRLVVLRSAAKSELVRATSLITWPALIAPVIGPALGGLITSYASWRWNFFLNIPLGIAGVAAVLLLVPNEAPAERRALDLPGLGLTSIALVALLCGLESFILASNRWLTPALLLLGGFAVGTLAVRHLRRARTPLLDLSALGVQTFRAAAIGAGFVFRMALFATPFLLPLLFQIGFGRSAASAGLLILAYFVGNLGMKMFTTRMLAGFGFRPILVWNGVFAGLAIAACALLVPTTPAAWIGATLLAAGMTRSMQLTSINTVMFVDIAADKRGSAATLSSVAQELSNVVGIACAAALLNASQLLHGRSATTLNDIRIALFVVGVMAIGAALIFRRLPADAGAEVSGYVPRRRPRPLQPE